MEAEAEAGADDRGGHSLGSKRSHTNSCGLMLINIGIINKRKFYLPIYHI